MSISRSLLRSRLGALTLLLAHCPTTGLSQNVPAVVPSIEIVAGPQYQAGGIRRFLFGNGYRDLWTTPLRVPVLDLRTFAGGLRPVKEGGGFQTKSLRLITPAGVQYVFRSVDKPGVMLVPGFEGTVVETVMHDQVSASHPAAALITAAILEAAGVLHVTPIIAIMPDDALLGEFRADFANMLGTIEVFPSAPEQGTGFAGAIEVIDSDELLPLIDSTPRQRVDARALLAARLMDMLLNDWDRHPGQWKWAQMRARPRAWVPIPRDRDKPFVSYGGVVLRLASLVSPNLVIFDSTYPSVRALTWNSLELDRRLLGGLEKPVWDSVAAELVRRVTDTVIDAAVRMAPPEYLSAAPQLALTLKQRRDGLRGVAARFYRYLARVADIHATDATDVAVVTRVDDRFVDVQLAAGADTPYFRRRFDAEETREIRVYLHGGNDTAFIQGHVGRSIVVRVIGGNGSNALLDSSRVGRDRDPTRLYDAGRVDGVAYGPDTLYNRRPWVREAGRMVPPGRDRGGALVPVAGIRYNRDMGFLPRLGVSRVRYGFGRRPYSNRVELAAEYATHAGGFRIAMVADQRFEGTPVHALVGARMSDLEVLGFHGIGNATPDSSSPYFEVRQRQWMLRPALALALGLRSDLSLGPVVQLTVTDSTSGRFMSAARPYGFARFGQAGLVLALHHDSRDKRRDPHRGIQTDLTASVFPAVWDTKTAFGSIAGSTAAYLTLPVPVHPILVLRGGAKKVFGVFPYHEAAFIGGRGTLRSLDAQRYAGDASVFGGAELRLPLARFAFVLPLNVGIFGVVEAGRVYDNGASPGGWHTARGVGFWIGVLDPATAIRVCRQPGRSGPC